MEVRWMPLSRLCWARRSLGGRSCPRHGFYELIPCLASWWWLSSRGCSTGWRLQRVPLSRLQWLLEGPIRPGLGIAGRGRCHDRLISPLSGKRLWAIIGLWTFGISWFLSGRGCLACTWTSSSSRWLLQPGRQSTWLRPWLGRSFCWLASPCLTTF